MDYTAAIRWDELSQTYFAQYFVSGGPIVWFILLPMSVIAVYFIAELSITIRRKKLLPANIGLEIAMAAARHGVETIPARFGKKPDFVSRAICAVFEKTRKMTPSISLMSQIAAESLQEQGMKLLRKNEWCNLLGAVAPMVGLFGTVCGMIDAFNQLGIAAGQPRPAQLASAISVALVTTFWGLLIAIPCLFVHGVFRTRIESLTAEAAVEVETLLERLGELRTAGETGAPVVKERVGPTQAVAQKMTEATISRPVKPRPNLLQVPGRMEVPVKK
ncbi:MAG: MotA/TolQ/ExbB proton channel family protein [Planctomycetes bacterium]|nr:MotA/TolQ/ExbB proton channel family protein [Planctomycetota bacterium]